MFVKLKDNRIEFAPYEKDGIINYNAESNAEQLTADGYKVLVKSQPSDELKRPALSYTEDESKVYQVWSESPAEELQADVRAARNALLDATDKCVSVPDFPIAAEEKDLYIQYRAYLRDYTLIENWWLSDPMEFDAWVEINELETAE